MALSKARRKAKAKRREFRNKIKNEMKAAKDRKIRKDEISRISSEDKFENHFDTFELLQTLSSRMFFQKLEEALNKFGCNGTLELAESLLIEMGYKDKVSQILEVLQDSGGYCSCEILYNVVPKLYSDSYLYDVEMY